MRKLFPQFRRGCQAIGSSKQGAVGEDIRPPSGICQMCVDVFSRFRTIQMRQYTDDADSLADSSVALQPQLIPEFRLSNQDKSQRAHGIEAVIKTQRQASVSISGHPDLA